jgi:signal transduction histidine kinase
MRGFDRLRPHAGWTARLPARTVRLRLTLLYGALFLASGAVLLAITYLLVRHNTHSFVLTKSNGSSHAQLNIATPGQHLVSSAGQFAQARQARAQAARDQAQALHQLLVQSGIALAFMALVSIVLGWIVAGRVLRPLRTITQATREITEHNLHQRLAIDGPHDELRDLADTVNDLLARLESAFGAQRRFVSNAAHELRTPLTLLHALLEEQLTDPDATVDYFRATSRRLLVLGQEQERLLEALLTLASSERGLEHRDPFDLSGIADELLRSRREQAERLGLQIQSDLAAAPAYGDPALAKRLVANLIDNALCHNTPGGSIEVRTGARDRRAFIAIANSGPKLPTDELEDLFEPFRRLGADRTDQRVGHGLGLSIVRAIASAHHAIVTVQARLEGGLAIEVGFPGEPVRTRNLRDTATQVERVRSLR